MLRRSAVGRRIIELTEADNERPMTTLLGTDIRIVPEKPQEFELDGDEFGLVKSVFLRADAGALLVRVPAGRVADAILTGSGSIRRAMVPRRACQAQACQNSRPADGDQARDQHRRRDRVAQLLDDHLEGQGPGRRCRSSSRRSSVAACHCRVRAAARNRMLADPEDAR